MNECCQDPENRADGLGPRGGADPPPDVTVTYCSVCECRHFEAAIDPLELGVTVEA
jgi:hypothetical protein